MILVEVTPRAAFVELIAPCGTFFDGYANDSTLSRWAEVAAVLPPPVPDSSAPGKLRYPVVRLGEADTVRGPWANTTFKLVRLDTAMSASYLLTSSNTVWNCNVHLDARQAVALFGALRGDAVAGATSYELPSVDTRTREGRPHISGAWIGPSVVEREPSLKGSYRGLNYPRDLMGSGIAETVHLMFIVDSTGAVRPSSVRLIGTARPVFAKMALSALLASEWRPAERHGRPVPVFWTQDFHFSER